MIKHTRIAILNGIQRGESTHTQDQKIYPVNFKVISIIASKGRNGILNLLL